MTKAKTYCIVHKKITGNKSIQFFKTKNGRTIMVSICGISPHLKSHFVNLVVGENLNDIVKKKMNQ